MAAITENDEARAAEARSRRRQDQKVPFLINEDDGRLYPNVPRMRKKAGWRLYHGNPKATLEDRQRFLLGLSARRAVEFDPEPEAPLNLNTASLEELMSFAQDQYGIVLDPNKPIGKLRKQVYDLSQLPEDQLIEAIAAAGKTGPLAAVPGEPDEDEAAPAGRQEPEANDPAAVAARVAKTQAAEPVIPVFGGGLGLGAQPKGHPVETKAPTRGGRQPRNTVPA